MPIAIVNTFTPAGAAAAAHLWVTACVARWEKVEDMVGAGVRLCSREEEENAKECLGSQGQSRR